MIQKLCCNTDNLTGKRFISGHNWNMIQLLNTLQILVHSAKISGILSFPFSFLVVPIPMKFEKNMKNQNLPGYGAGTPTLTKGGEKINSIGFNRTLLESFSKKYLDNVYV